MTREEAIKILKSKLDGSVDTSWEWTESVRMAIEALEMQDLCAEMLESAKDTNVLTKDLISRADAIDALGDEPDVWNDTDAEWAERDAWVMHKVAIESLPSVDAVEVVRCKDCVYCTVQNTKYIYAICQRHGIEFKPFEDDTRTHFCAWGERREP